MAAHHELAHLYAWLGKKRMARSVNSLWLEEGLAEGTALPAPAGIFPRFVEAV